MNDFIFILLMSIMAGALAIALAFAVRGLIDVDEGRWAKMNYAGMGIERQRSEWRRLL